MGQGHCGVKSFSDLYSLQTNANVAAEGCGYSMLKVMKQRCYFLIWLNFTVQATRNFSRAMAWMRGWSFPLCG